MIRTVLATAMVAGLAAPAWPCTVVGPLPSPASLVGEAEVIVRVRADALSPTPGVRGSLDESQTQVTFTILEVLKGELWSATIDINGVLVDEDDPNDRPVPYDFIRPGGRGGNCFALGYRAGAEYLLLLRADKRRSDASGNTLTPYWAPLSPTNEQLFGGADDPWVKWVRRRLRTR